MSVPWMRGFAAYVYMETVFCVSGAWSAYNGDVIFVVFHLPNCLTYFSENWYVRCAQKYIRSYFDPDFTWSSTCTLSDASYVTYCTNNR
jgi:hypothetical protein